MDVDARVSSNTTVNLTEVKNCHRRLKGSDVTSRVLINIPFQSEFKDANGLPADRLFSLTDTTLCGNAKDCGCKNQRERPKASVSGGKAAAPVDMAGAGKKQTGSFDHRRRL
jgi:hypothetical protein